MLTTYIIGCVALIIKPGPDLMCTLATAISDGKVRASTLMAGLILGCWFWVLLLSAGVASFFIDHPVVMTSIQIVGIAYIGYLALGSFKEAWAGFRQRGESALSPAKARGWRLVGRGVFMSMSNPLTILFFLAFLPNFTKEDSTFAPALQVVSLGSLFCASAWLGEGGGGSQARIGPDARGGGGDTGFASISAIGDITRL